MSDDEDRFLEQLDRVTWRVARALMVGVPSLFVLLFLVPTLIPTIGPMPALVLALVGAGTTCWALEHRLSRRHPSGPTGPWIRRPSGPMLAVIACGAVILLAYIVVILSVAGR